VPTPSRGQTPLPRTTQRYYFDPQQRQTSTPTRMAQPTIRSTSITAGPRAPYCIATPLSERAKQSFTGVLTLHHVSSSARGSHQHESQIRDMTLCSSGSYVQTWSPWAQCDRRSSRLKSFSHAAAATAPWRCCFTLLTSGPSAASTERSTCTRETDRTDRSTETTRVRSDVFRSANSFQTSGHTVNHCGDASPAHRLAALLLTAGPKPRTVNDPTSYTCGLERVAQKSNCISDISMLASCLTVPDWSFWCSSRLHPLPGFSALAGSRDAMRSCRDRWGRQRKNARMARPE